MRGYHASLGELIHNTRARWIILLATVSWSCSVIPCRAPDPGDEGPSIWPRKCATWSPESSVKWRAYGPELDFGIGIARGYATLGRIGFEGRFDYSAIGTVVNLAAPLREAKARPNSG